MAEPAGAARQRARDLFTTTYGAAPTMLVRSPGRVNLIGDHTDYNDGFVLPMAINLATWFAVRPTDGTAVALVSETEGPVLVDLTDPHQSTGTWAKYPAGVAWALADAGVALHGWEGALASDLPVGAGVSSSAAIQLGTAAVFAALADMAWDPLAMARAVQHSEIDFVGMPCGIMDQLTLAASAAGTAMLLDCRTLTWEPVRLPAEAAVVVLDTGTRRTLVGSAYAERRAACERVAAAAGVRALRDLDMAELAVTPVDDADYRRARHVITENDRVRAFAAALGAGDLPAAGRLLGESHLSLRDDYEVSGPALDAMVDAAVASAGCFGARMTGAGFAGCCVALVARDHLASFLAGVLATYEAMSVPGLVAPAAAYHVEPSAGTAVVP